MGYGEQLREQINNIWEKLTTWQKATFIAVVIIAVVLMGILFAQGPKMEVLYSGLSPENASAITAKLKEQKVSYELVDEGRTILVSANDKYQLRLDMAGQVNLKGVVGFESFNETRFGETDTDKRVRFLVALQGELTRTIEEMDEVEVAKVHIALPQPSLFIRDEKDTTASVLLRMKTYAVLRPEQVKSIMSFVSNSVEGLEPANVTVMDVNGNLLSEGFSTSSSLDSSHISANQLALKQQYEKEFAQSLQTMLEKMKGSGKAVVRASITMDFDKVEKHSETYGEPVLTSEQVKEESSTGTSQTGGANPADANMGGPSYGTLGSAGENEYQLTERTRNYEVSKTVETKIVAPGKITNISLSVLIDGNLTPEEENKLKEAVTMAAGADLTRGDQVSVVGMAFNNEELSKMEQALAERETFQRRMAYIKLIAIPLSIILVLGFVFFTVRRAIRSSARYSINKARELAAAKVAEEVELTLSPEAMEKKAMQTQIDNLIKKNPEEVAKVVKTWLVEE